MTLTAGPEPCRMASSLRVVPLVSPVHDAIGHDPRSVYAETYWLPVIGPSALWLARRLAWRLDAQPDGFDVDLAELSAEIGLAPSTARHAPVTRTVRRLADFDCAELDGFVLRARRMLAPLHRGLVGRLPAYLREQHARELTRPKAAS